MKNSEKIQELKQELDTDDVAQKRFLMYHIFDLLIEERFQEVDKTPETAEKISELKEFDGYLYKLSQDFLTSSSTLEKENKLEKIIEHVERKT